MAESTHDNNLADKVQRALEICWEETTKRNEGEHTYAFLASEFAANGKNLFDGELRMLNVMLRDAVNINMYGRYGATVYTGNRGIMVAFQPVADLEDIIEMRF